MRAPLTAALVLFLATAAAAADPPDALSASLSRLSAALDRLSVALERDAAQRGGEREAQRVQVAVSILGLRTRKVDGVEAELRGAANEEEDLKGQLAAVQAQLADNEDQRIREGREATEGEREMREQLTRGVRMMEQRIRVLEERRSALQAELSEQLRGLARLEAILNDWLDRGP